jgi:hypothetical protein
LVETVQLSDFGKKFPIAVAQTVNNTIDLMARPVRESAAGDFPLCAGQRITAGLENGCPTA